MKLSDGGRCSPARSPLMTRRACWRFQRLPSPRPHRRWRSKSDRQMAHKDGCLTSEGCCFSGGKPVPSNVGNDFCSRKTEPTLKGSQHSSCRVIVAGRCGDARRFKERLLRPLTGVGRVFRWPPGVSSLRSSTARRMGIIPAGIKKITPSTVIEKNLLFSRFSVFGNRYPRCMPPRR